MRIKRLLWVSISILVLTVTLKAQDVQGTWNGTMTMHQKATTMTGSFDFTVKLIIRDNEVTGTVEGTSTLTLANKSASSTCKGSGIGTLWRVSLNQDGTYDIEAMSPVYSCTGPDLFTGVVHTMEANPLSLTVSSKPIGSNPNVLVGSHTNQSADNLVTGSTTTTWNLVRSKGLELIVVPLDYENWLPVPGKDELTKGSVLPVAVRLQSTNGKPPALKAKKFEIKLSGTSNEPGITINAPLEPLKGDASLPDIRLLPAATGRLELGAQEMTIDCNCLTANFSLAAFDGGGYSTLTVEATLEDNSIIKGHLLVSGGETEILIPKRDAGSSIAKAWLDANGNPGDSDDKEQLKGNPNMGDGLSAYEEYRGVISEGRFKRLDPQTLEAGVWMDIKSAPLFAEGIRWLERAAGIRVVRFIDNEIGADRVFNKNNATAHVYLQYVQKLQNSSVAEGVGENVPAELTVKTPRQSERVVIDVSKIRQNYQDQKRSLQLTNARYHLNLQMPYTEQEQLANTVAHELAHGLDVDHHGELSPPLDSARIPADGFTVYHIFPKYAPEITERPYTIQGIIGTIHNDESGDLSCIMAYTSYYQWVKREESNGDINFYEAGLLPYGRTLCKTKPDPDAKSINYSNKYFGDAQFGNCLSQVRFK